MDTIKIFVAYSNTDLMEGKGRKYPYVISNNRFTAERLGKQKSVRGSDCEIVEMEAIYHNDILYGPISLYPPTKEDIEAEQEQQIYLEKMDRKNKVIERLKSMGVTDEDLNTLKG